MVRRALSRSLSLAHTHGRALRGEQLADPRPPPGYHIPGSLRASQFEREITRDASRAREREEFRPHEEPAQPTASFRRVSKMANHPCYCGSGRKYKRCCRAVDEAADGAPPQLEVVLSDDEGAAGAARVGGRR
jgi:hypothetical protein